VLQQRLPAASHPQVERLGLVLVVEVRRVVGHVLLDAGPRGVEVAAAEGDAAHQVLPLHVAPESAGKREAQGRCSCIDI